MTTYLLEKTDQSPPRRTVAAPRPSRSTPRPPRPRRHPLSSSPRAVSRKSCRVARLTTSPSPDARWLGCVESAQRVCAAGARRRRAPRRCWPSSWRTTAAASSFNDGKKKKKNERNKTRDFMVPDFFPGKSVPFTRKQSALASGSLDESESRAVYKKATFPEVMLCCAARTLCGRQAPRRTSLFSFFFLPRRKTDSRTSISFIRVSFESRTLKTRAMRINHSSTSTIFGRFFYER